MQTDDQVFVLFAEDEDSFRRSISLELRSRGMFRVREVDSGESAIEALKADKFDVVLLDFKIGEVSGLNVLQWMHEQKLETPVIMFTGAGSETIAVEAMKLGAYDYVRKDLIDQDHLPVLIRGVFERFLFRKDRDERSKLQKERVKNLSVLELLHNASSFYSHLINTTLSSTLVDLEQIELDLKASDPKGSQESVAQTFAGLRQQSQLILLVTKSLVDLSRLMYEKFEGVQNTTENEQRIAQELDSLQKKYTSNPLLRK